MADHSNITDTRTALQILPGRGLGWMNLGASIHAITSRLKAHPQLYPQLSLSYSLEEPVLRPIHLELPRNDIRLRFDGPDQRLRLIEITGWSQVSFTYKSTEVARRLTQVDKATEGKSLPIEHSVPGPSFRHVYNRLFGPAYAGEYIPPVQGQSLGTYVLSYPGLAIRFPLKHSSYSDKADFVSLLSSAALPATSIAIFSGASWPEARATLYTKPPPLPRSIALAGKNVESVPDEIENVIICSGGRVELTRRCLQPFVIVLSETTPQDLVAELGPPDAIFRKTSSRISIHAGHQPGISRHIDVSPSFPTSSADTGPSSNTSHTSGFDDDSEVDAQGQTNTDSSIVNSECFYNYFHHGFDVLIARPAIRSPVFPGLDDQHLADPATKLENKLVATKFFLHGNIPGSYSFNRHRRSRWTIPIPSTLNPPEHNASAALNLDTDSDVDLLAQQPKPRRKQNRSRDLGPNTTGPDAHTSTPDPQHQPTNPPPALTSEMRFSTISQTLSTIWSNHKDSRSAPAAGDQYTSKGMVLNRGWSADHDSSPDSSVELLGGTMTMDDSMIAPIRTKTNTSKNVTAETATAAVEKGGGNTQLFGFPGMLFEVLDNGGVSCVSVY